MKKIFIFRPGGHRNGLCERATDIYICLKKKVTLCGLFFINISVFTVYRSVEMFCFDLKANILFSRSLCFLYKKVFGPSGPIDAKLQNMFSLLSASLLFIKDTFFYS